MRCNPHMVTVHVPTALSKIACEPEAPEWGFREKGKWDDASERAANASKASGRLGSEGEYGGAGAPPPHSGPALPLAVCRLSKPCFHDYVIIFFFY